MTRARSSGILLHFTSLPGRFGVGDAGPEAHRFLERLAAAGQTVWQVLPLGPTSYGNSPYQSLSAFALNPLLVSPERLLDDGLVEPADLDTARRPAASRVDFAGVLAARERLLHRAHERFREGRARDAAEFAAAFDSFRRGAASWLPDFALFRAIKDAEQGRAWVEWPRELRLREPAALERASREHAEAIERIELAQHLAFSHWRALREHARELGVSFLGDVPIFVAADSADVWARRELFDLDEDGGPRAVAGVPPDYFSESGQLWGNPLYRWDVLAERGFDWWIARLGAAFALADRVRIDHFRGFEAHWEVPAGALTAAGGRWVKGPGRSLFDALERALGPLAIVAEDLGEITPEVDALRDALGYPGMRVLQFGFAPDAREDRHAPHNFARNCVAYTGTHDNDTSVGWFRGSPGATTRSAREIAAEMARVLAYLGTTGERIHWDLIRLLLESVADTAIVPMQDVLGLGTEARLNTPGRPEGNWEWRLAGDGDAGSANAGGGGSDDGPRAFDAAMARLAEMTRTYGRAPAPRAQST